MGELSVRALTVIVATGLIIVGIVSMSETVLPSKTSLAPSTAVVQLMGPVIALIGAGVFMFGRTIPRKRRPTPAVLTGCGTLAALVPVVIWGAGFVFAREDSAFWAPAVAAVLLLLTVPGLGMAIGGARRLGKQPAEPTRPGQGGPRVKRRR